MSTSATVESLPLGRQLYPTPFFALLPELRHTPRERPNLSTWISITFALVLLLSGPLAALGALPGVIGFVLWLITAAVFSRYDGRSTIG